jgi:hypothetical protein
MKSRASKSVRRSVRNAVVMTALAAAFTVVGIALAAGPAVTEPTITSAPASLTSQTSATFTFTDSQAGVSFQCQLDGSAYTSCVSGVKYTGLADGNHTFKVQAVSGSKASSAATHKWTVDSTAPSPSLTFPADGGFYNAAGWAEGCPVAGVCGKAKDTQGVTSVGLSIRQGTGNWWGGSSFNKTSETFNVATLETPGAKASTWRYPIALPPAGSYTVHVRAGDEAGNTTPAGSQAQSSFTIKTAAPPAPTIQSGPEETSEKSATFVFSDSEAGVGFLCAKDDSKFTSCTSPKVYETVSQGEHTFFVQARDAAGNVSPATQHSWTVFTKTFSIEGKLSGTLAPGVSQPLALTVTNPNTKPITVTGLQVTVAPGSTKAGCDGPTNLQVTQSNASSSNSFTVPAKGGKATVPVGSVSAPQVLMKNLGTNQDACKGASFTFNYSGNAHS